jgi:hypothetical protein
MESIGKLIDERFKNNSFTSKQQKLLARGYYWGKHIALTEKGADEKSIKELYDKFQALSHELGKCKIYLTITRGICLNCSDCSLDKKYWDLKNKNYGSLFTQNPIYTNP